MLTCSRSILEHRASKCAGRVPRPSPPSPLPLRYKPEPTSESFHHVPSPPPSSLPLPPPRHLGGLHPLCLNPREAPRKPRGPQQPKRNATEWPERPLSISHFSGIPRNSFPWITDKQLRCTRFRIKVSSKHQDFRVQTSSKRMWSAHPPVVAQKLLFALTVILGVLVRGLMSCARLCC